MSPASRTEVSEVVPSIQEIARLAVVPEVQAACEWCSSQEAQIATWQLLLAAIPAPPFGEAARAHWLADRFPEICQADRAETVCQPRRPRIFPKRRCTLCRQQ